MQTAIIRRYIQVFSTLFLQGAILFISAGTLRWNWAWIFIAVGVVILIFNGLVLPREVIEERGSRKTNVKKWDKVLTNIAIFPFLGIYIVAGLDYRFGWSGAVSGTIHIIGLVTTYSGSLLFTWAMVSNLYFSTKVRIQDDRSHQVATGGPYKFVRHPGYIGYFLMVLATPVALGAWYALSFSILLSILFVIRTALEDKTLFNELAGYREYAAKVKYRLIPFVW